MARDKRDGEGRVHHRDGGMTFWWLSFCDPHKPEGSQFLGACIVEAPAMELAAPAAWLLGCNPGGEVMIVEVEIMPPPEFVGRLMDRAEIGCMERRMRQ
jgi:hypothetical protein